MILQIRVCDKILVLAFQLSLYIVWTRAERDFSIPEQSNLVFVCRSLYVVFDSVHVKELF